MSLVLNLIENTERKVEAVLETKLKDLKKNIKYWTSQGFTNFKVKVTDTNITINVEVKK